ncbi:MAG: hypothetical protein RIS34_2486, partial [Pseudomonadota bacterium]
MKGILGLLRHRSQVERTGEEPLDSVMFTTAFADQGIDASLLVPWEARAAEVGAKKFSPERGTKTLQGLWAKDKYMSHLDDEAIKSLQGYFDFASVPANRDVIRQDEYGNFMVVLLNGNIAVDRLQPWGERLRLAETRPGDILGEMSLLDSGIRFSACTTISDCEIAVLGTEAMDQMMTANPSLAARL